MAVGMFKLTQKQRGKLYVVFTALNIIQILLGFGMTSSSIYIVVDVSPSLYTEKAQVNFVFVITGIYGTHIMFHWIIGIAMCKKCYRQAHKKSTSKLLLLWYFAGTNTVVILIVISHFARKSGKQIIKSMKNSISTGMTHYASDPTWKEVIDRLQYSNECCGIDSYQNWHETAWLSKYQVDVNSETIKSFRSSQDALLLPITPWSCCRIDFPMQCLHDPVQQMQYAHLWVDEPNIVKDSINTKGCLDGIKKPILLVINLFIFFTSMVFVVQIAIFLISRILYTASRNAVLLHDPEGIAPGWVFGRGDCGYAGGKPLAEIMGLSPRPSGLVSAQSGGRGCMNMNFGRMIPKRFRRNRKNKENEESSKLLGETTTDFEGEDTPEFNPVFHSTQIYHGIPETEHEDETEVFSMEGKMEKMETPKQSGMTENKKSPEAENDEKAKLLGNRTDSKDNSRAQPHCNKITDQLPKEKLSKDKSSKLSGNKSADFSSKGYESFNPKGHSSKVDNEKTKNTTSPFSMEAEMEKMTKG